MVRYLVSLPSGSGDNGNVGGDSSGSGVVYNEVDASGDVVIGKAPDLVDLVVENN